MNDMIYTVGQLKQTYIDATIDARGEAYKAGDIVIQINKTYRSISLFICGETQNFSYERNHKKCSNDYLNYSSYLFKVTDYENTYLKDIVDMEDKISKYNVFHNYDIEESDLRNVMENREYCYRITNGVNNIRSMGICDWLGRKVEVGNFVYFVDKSFNIKYGVVMSDKEVFTCDLKKQVLHHVFMVEQLTDREKIAKIVLAKSFNTQARKYRREDVQVGDLYRVGKGIYVYLGNFEFRVHNKFPTNYWLEYFKHDSHKKTWFKLGVEVSNEIVDKCNDLKYLKSLMFETLNCTRIEDLCTWTVDKYKYTNFYSVIGFECFKSTISANGYIGHVDLGKSLLLTPSEEQMKDDDMKLKAYNIEFVF